MVRSRGPINARKKYLGFRKQFEATSSTLGSGAHLFTFFYLRLPPLCFAYLPVQLLAMSFFLLRRVRRRRLPIAGLSTAHTLGISVIFFRAVLFSVLVFVWFRLQLIRRNMGEEGGLIQCIHSDLLQIAFERDMKSEVYNGTSTRPKSLLIYLSIHLVIYSSSPFEWAV